MDHFKLSNLVELAASNEVEGIGELDLADFPKAVSGCAFIGTLWAVPVKRVAVSLAPRCGIWFASNMVAALRALAGHVSCQLCSLSPRRIDTVRVASIVHGRMALVDALRKALAMARIPGRRCV